MNAVSKDPTISNYFPQHNNFLGSFIPQGMLFILDFLNKNRDCGKVI